MTTTTVNDPRDARIDIDASAGSGRVVAYVSNGNQTWQELARIDHDPRTTPNSGELLAFLDRIAELSTVTGIPVHHNQIWTQQFADRRQVRAVTTHDRLHADEACVCFD